MRPILKFPNLRLARTLSRFHVADDGVTAIEFAFVAPIFIALLIAIIQSMIFLFSQQVLQEAATNAGRLIMTGQVQNSGLTQSQFQADICPMISVLFTCGNLMVNVQTYDSYSDANTTVPTLTYNAQGQVTNTWSYNPGAPGDIVVVQLIYPEPVVNGLLGFAFSDLQNGTAEMVGATAIRVEPY